MLLLALTFLLAIINPVTFAQKDSIRIPLYRQKSPRESGINLGNVNEFSTNWMKPYYDGPTNDTVAVYRYLDSQFYGIIQIGKKARPFNLLLDTSWGHTWVMSEDCPYKNVGCWFHNRYNHDKSSTYVQNGTEIFIPMGTYNMSGYLSEDVFYLSQMNVTNQTFIEMTDLPDFYILSKADGILGLGYSSLSKGINTILYNLVKQKRIKQALFSIYFNRDASSNRGGDLYLGRIEKRHILENNTITYLPVNQTGYWQVKMDNITLDDGHKNISFCVSDCQAIIDTGSMGIIGPGKDIRKLNRLINAKYIMYGRYQVACETVNKLPEISFVIGGKYFTLHGRDYIQNLAYKSVTLCLSTFTAWTDDTKNKWVLGGAFLSEFYTIYDMDNNKFGLVKAA